MPAPHPTGCFTNTKWQEQRRPKPKIILAKLGQNLILLTLVLDGPNQDGDIPVCYKIVKYLEQLFFQLDLENRPINPIRTRNLFGIHQQSYWQTNQTSTSLKWGTNVSALLPTES